MCPLTLSAVLLVLGGISMPFVQVCRRLLGAWRRHTATGRKWLPGHCPGLARRLFGRR